MKTQYQKFDTRERERERDIFLVVCGLYEMAMCFKSYRDEGDHEEEEGDMKVRWKQR